MTLTFQGGYSFTLSGNVEAASEERKFSSGIYKLTPNARNIPKIRIEASMNFEFPEWKVKLIVYERERADAERGEVRE
jgi:hypothetical protein